MADGVTWWLAEIYQVRLSKFFEESDEDEESSETYYEELREHSEEQDIEGNPVLYKEYYDMHDMPIIHPCWQQQDNIVHKKEKDNAERVRVFNQSYIDHLGKQVIHETSKIEQDPQDITN